MPNDRRRRVPGFGRVSPEEWEQAEHFFEELLRGPSRPRTPRVRSPWIESNGSGGTGGSRGSSTRGTTTTTPSVPACNCALGRTGERLRVELAQTIESTITTLTPHATGSHGRTGPTGLLAGNYDYHSSVHAHWALLDLYRRTGDTAGLRRIHTRVTETKLDQEWAFLQGTSPPYEQPYGRAWLLLLLSELQQHTGRTTTASTRRREQVTNDVLTWLENHTSEAGNNATLGIHGSWLFTFFLVVLSAPTDARSRRRISALDTRVVARRRASWRSHTGSSGDFLHVPSVADAVEILLGRAPAVTPAPILPTRRTPTAGHAVGEAMTRLWPIALRARTDPAMCTLLKQHLDAWLRHSNHWKYGNPSSSTFASQFTDNSHWTPQFLWMVIRLRCP